MEASKSQLKYSSLILRPAITWSSVVSSAFTGKMSIFWGKNNKNATIFKGVLQIFRASRSLSFSCQLKLNSNQCEHEYFFCNILSWVGAIKQSPSAKMSNAFGFVT